MTILRRTMITLAATALAWTLLSQGGSASASDSAPAGKLLMWEHTNFQGDGVEIGPTTGRIELDKVTRDCVIFCIDDWDQLASSFKLGSGVVLTVFDAHLDSCANFTGGDSHLDVADLTRGIRGVGLPAGRSWNDRISSIALTPIDRTPPRCAGATPLTRCLQREAPWTTPVNRHVWAGESRVHDLSTGWVIRISASGSVTETDSRKQFGPEGDPTYLPTNDLDAVKWHAPGQPHHALIARAEHTVLQRREVDYSYDLSNGFNPDNHDGQPGWWFTPGRESSCIAVWGSGKIRMSSNELVLPHELGQFVHRPTITTGGFAYRIVEYGPAW